MLSPLLLALATLHCAAAQASGPVVDLGYAQYQGAFNATSNTTNFLGVRFAAAPTGDLRFRAPQPPANVSGVQQANAFGAQCNQAGNGQSPTNPLDDNSTSTANAIGKRAVPSDEDCLFLNVFTPGTDMNTSLPVVVWIHGGGYIAGNGDASGQDVVRESGFGVVFVGIQYRLGLFGFLPGAAVKDGGALNAGLLDQNFALQWVQSHIASFGGDPTKVTIWGESAGAGSVMQQVIAHGGNTQPPLFRGAISSSLFVPSQYNFSDRIPELLYSEVVDQANCSSSTDTLECLRAAPVAQLESINTAINAGGFFGTFVFVPVIDGDFIVEAPSATLGKGQHNADVLLAMTNSFEGTVFVNNSAASSDNVTEYILDLFPNVTPEQAARFAPLYAATGLPVQAQVDAVQGESIFICPTYVLLRAFSNGTAAFKGEFAIPPALHAQDVAFYFPTSSGPPTFTNATFITAFSEAFTDMIRSLDPNAKFDPANITPQWAHFADGDTEMLFNRTDAGDAVVHPITTDAALLQRCALWNEIAAFTAQ